MSDDDDSDPKLKALLQQFKSVPVSTEELSLDCTQLLERLRQIPKDIPSEQTAVALEDFSTLPFQQIGQYELLERIAGGGMGEVFKARQQKLGNLVAIKLLYRDRVTDRQLLDRFEQEMRAVGRLNHEHIVKPLYADEQNGVPYLVMEYVEGKTLAALLEEYTAAGKPFPIELACESIRQAAIGLGHAHQHGIIHRDIKPSNLMLAGVSGSLSVVSGQPANGLPTTDNKPTLKILDLGLARLNDPASDDKQSRKADLTREGQVMGTPDYMAPEQLENSRLVDARTDVYALGATLFKLLTGRAPYADAGDGSLTAKLMAIASQPCPTVKQFRSDVPAELDALVRQMLSKSPNDRPQTAMQVAEAMRPFASDGGWVLLPVDPTRRARVPILQSRRWSNSVRLMMAVVALGLCVALGLMIRSLTETGISVGQLGREPRPTSEPPPASHFVSPAMATTPPDPDRAAAEWLLSLKPNDWITILIQPPDSGVSRWITPGESLPDEPFCIVFIRVWRTDALTDDDIGRFIVPLRSLRSLQIDFCDWVTDAAVPIIRQSSMLAELGVALTKIRGPACLKLFEELPGLSSVTISHDQFTDEMADYFCSSPKITSVTLHNGSDTQLRQLMRAKHLTQLWFYTPFSVETATWRELANQLPNLERMGTSTSNFSVADLTEIARCPNLREMWLHNNPLTDTDLLPLRACQNLRFLEVKQTKVTEAGVRILHEHLPQCRIEWDGGVIEPKS